MKPIETNKQVEERVKRMAQRQKDRNPSQRIDTTYRKYSRKNG